MNGLIVHQAQSRQFLLRHARRLWKPINFANTSSTPLMMDDAPVRLGLDQLPPMQHHRIVFKEVGTPIHDAENIKSALAAACDAIRALEIMFRHGKYVHRDVSPGNIWLVEGGKAKLADLEYAKVMSSSGKEDGQTGTAAFMSVEVSEGGYFFITVPSWVSLDNMPAKPIFVHNPIHDRESIWWIFLWILFSNTVADETAPDPKFVLSQASKQRSLAIQLSHYTAARIKIFCLSYSSQIHCTYGPFVHPVSRPYIWPLCRLLYCLLDAYRAVETLVGAVGGHVQGDVGEELIINVEPFDNLHTASSAIFQEALSNEELQNYDLISLSKVLHRGIKDSTKTPPPIVRPLKRQRIL